MSTRAKVNARDLSTAYHEAGHAVIAWWLGVHLEAATIEPNEAEGYQGAVVAKFMTAISHKIEYDITPGLQRRVENYAVHTLAGVGAQRKFNPRSVRSYHSRADDQAVVNLLSYLCDPSSKVWKPYVAFMVARARAAVENPINWRAIEVLAKELIRRRTMKGKEPAKIHKQQ